MKTRSDPPPEFAPPEAPEPLLVELPLEPPPDLPPPEQPAANPRPAEPFLRRG